MHEIEPHGLLWDRDLWYLVGRSLEANEIRMWRADRVLSIRVTGMAFRPASDFDIRALLGRQWLERAMRTWDIEKEGSRIRMSADAASRLRRDWYYRHAAYLEGDDGQVVMSIPDTDPGSVLPLVRWLGEEAEILEPPACARSCAPSSMRSGWPMPDRRASDHRRSSDRSRCWQLPLAFALLARRSGAAPTRVAVAARASQPGSLRFREEAARAGLSERTLAALDGLTFDDRVLKQDRGQPTLSQSFLDFVDRVVSADRLARGRALLKKHAATFAADRARLWRSRAGDRRLLGTGDRLRRLHGRLSPRSARWRRLPTTAAGRSIFAPS